MGGRAKADATWHRSANSACVCRRNVSAFWHFILSISTPNASFRPDSTMACSSGLHHQGYPQCSLTSFTSFTSLARSCCVRQPCHVTKTAVAIRVANKWRNRVEPISTHESPMNEAQLRLHMHHTDSRGWPQPAEASANVHQAALAGEVALRLKRRHHLLHTTPCDAAVQALHPLSTTQAPLQVN